MPTGGSECRALPGFRPPTWPGERWEETALGVPWGRVALPAGQGPRAWDPDWTAGPREARGQSEGGEAGSHVGTMRCWYPVVQGP